MFPTGSLVELNTGEVALVIEQNRVRRLRPKLMLLLNPDKTPVSRHALMDLKAKPAGGDEEMDPELAALMKQLEGGDDAARRDFAALRQLRDSLQLTCPMGVSLTELSMGMSGDYEIAIEEGATMVRVGSALFEGLA